MATFGQPRDIRRRPRRHDRWEAQIGAMVRQPGLFLSTLHRDERRIRDSRNLSLLLEHIDAEDDVDMSTAEENRPEKRDSSGADRSPPDPTQLVGSLTAAATAPPRFLVSSFSGASLS